MTNIKFRDDRDPAIAYVGTWGLAGTTSEYLGYVFTTVINPDST